MPPIPDSIAAAIAALIAQGGFALVAVVGFALWWVERRGREKERADNLAAERASASEMQLLGIESARANQRIADVLQQLVPK